MPTQKPSPYEKEMVDLLLGTKAKAVMFLVVDGVKGTSFECRCVDEKYLRTMPTALIEIASRIEGDFAKRAMEIKKIEDITKRKKKSLSKK